MLGLFRQCTLLFLAAVDPMLLWPDDPFRSAILSQDVNFARRVNSMNPISKGESGYVWAQPDFFMSPSHLEYGQSFMYDAVMSVGIGACLAAQNANGTVSGISHLKGIRQAQFKGASGNVEFQNAGIYPGARVPNDIIWVTFNFLPTLNASAAPYELSAAIGNGGETWILPLKPFIYADGTHSPPPLRTPPNENYLSPGLRIFGFVMLGMVLSTAILAAAWVHMNSASRVLRASQPPFLMAIILGSAVFASASFPLSFDEGYGWTTEQLGRGCMAVPWLIFAGFSFTYGAIYSKLYRVNKVVQFTRQRPGTHFASWPAIMFLLAGVTLLAVWNALDPMYWQRVVLNEYSGDSMGRCNSDNIGAYFSLLVILMVATMILTGAVAWTTRNVDEIYSESWWIVLLIVLQLEIILISIPLSVVLRNASTNGRYAGYVVVLCIFPLITMIVLILPKVVTLRRINRAKARRYRKRSQRKPASERRKQMARMPSTTKTPPPETVASYQQITTLESSPYLYGPGPLPTIQSQAFSLADGSSSMFDGDFGAVDFGNPPTQ